MKKLLLSFLIILFCLPSCTAQESQIGKISGKDFVLTVDLKDLKMQSENHLREQGISTELVTFEILQDYVEGTKDIYYMLLAKNKDQSIKLATTLQLNNGTFTYQGKLYASSCVCNGCTRGCSPRHHSDDGIIEWYCSSCSKGTVCSKSETGAN